MVEDVLFGTEKISLAALSKLAGMHLKDKSDPFPEAAARALRRLGDTEVLVFLVLMSNSSDFQREENNPFEVYSCDPAQLIVDRIDFSTLGYCEEDLYASIAEFMNRRIFLADYSMGRLRGGPVRSFFGVTEVTRKYFELLHDSARVADEQRLRALSISTSISI